MVNVYRVKEKREQIPWSTGLQSRGYEEKPGSCNHCQLKNSYLNCFSAAPKMPFVTEVKSL